MRFNNVRIFYFVVIPLVFFAACKNTKTEFWPNGTKKSEIQLKNNAYNGHAAYWYDNGNKELECYYLNNILHGPMIRYYPNGHKKEGFSYNMGKLDGLFTSWNTDGSKAAESAFINGILNGPYHEFYPDGTLMVEGHYLDGKFTKKWLYYNSEGNIVGIGNFDHGSGIQQGFYSNGKLKRAVRYKDNLKDGEEIEYDIRGDVTAIRVYRKGNLTETLRK